MKIVFLALTGMLLSPLANAIGPDEVVKNMQLAAATTV
jgi:hypothetical protein